MKKDAFVEAFDTVVNNTDTEKIVYHMGEEVLELGVALHKLHRTIVPGDPTNVTFDEALEMVKEEFNDICLYADLLGIEQEASRKEKKMIRWAGRLMEEMDG